jgi:hypothetical protein
MSGPHLVIAEAGKTGLCIDTPCFRDSKPLSPYPNPIPRLSRSLLPTPLAFRLPPKPTAGSPRTVNLFVLPIKRPFGRSSGVRHDDPPWPECRCNVLRVVGVFTLPSCPPGSYIEDVGDFVSALEVDTENVFAAAVFVWNQRDVPPRGKLGLMIEIGTISLDSAHIAVKTTGNQVACPLFMYQPQ